MVIGRKAATRHVLLGEVAAFCRDGKSVPICQPFHRTGSRDGQIEGISARLLSIAPDTERWTFRTSFLVFLLMLHPAGRPSLHQAVEAAALGLHPAPFPLGASTEDAPWHRSNRAAPTGMREGRGSPRLSAFLRLCEADGLGRRFEPPL